VKFPVSISKWKICDCGKGDWQVIKIEKDDKLLERFNQLPKKTQRAVLRDYKRKGQKMSTYQYILTIRCRGCGFTWDKCVSENMLKKVEAKK